MNPFTYKLGQRIRTADRITVLIVVVSLLLLAVASYGAWHVKQLQDRSEAMLTQNVESIRAAVELELHIQELRHQLDLYLWRHNLSDLEKTKFTDSKAFKTERADIDVWLHRAEASAHTRKEEQLILKVHDGLGMFYRQIELLAKASNLDAEKLALAEEAEAILAEEVLPPAREYLNADEALLEANRQKAASQSHRLARMLLLLGVFGSLAALAAGYAIARTIHRSLVQLHIPMQNVAGKLSEVAGDFVVSTKLDLDDLGPALQRVSTEVTEVVEQLHARHREIVRADQLASLGQLAAGLAHEIRNPLMAMKMLVQTAQQQQGPGGLDGRDLQIMDDEIRRLEHLLTEFLDFARPTPLKRTIVDVRGIVESTVDFVQRQADARGATLHCHLPAEPVMLEIDAPRIRQVVLNLLVNAIHAAPTGGNIWITIEPTTGGKPSGYRIKVADDGPGIGPRETTRIFEPFYSTKETGMGLGLAVSQRIVRSHGGELALDRGDYSGAVFVIELPLPTERARIESTTGESVEAK
ncbi:sensor histidine kinase [Lacipirellula sp.]|uniref:sensor histidine kinase n=1 Tax=Lacipirellula sp. TaxID=2691419 RepID=UPI003D15013C